MVIIGEEKDKNSAFGWRGLIMDPLKDYLEAQGYLVKSPRETIKQAYQIELINEGHVWLDALAKRSLTTHTYDDAFADKLVKEIKLIFYLN